MKASTAQVLCIGALVGVATLYLSRPANREERALSCDGGAASSTERAASSIVMKDPYLVQIILDFVGPGQQLYLSTVSKLVRQCYGSVQAIECSFYCLKTAALIKVIVTSQMTQFSEMCSSKSRLMLAGECGVQIASQQTVPRRAADRLLAACSNSYRCRLATAAVDDASKMQKLLLGRNADKALLTFAYDHFGLPFYSVYVTLGAITCGDLDKLQWLCLVRKAAMCFESSAIAARHGHTSILKWLYEIKFPIDAETCCEAAYRGCLNVLQLLHAEGHEWHERTGLLAATGGHLEVVQWLSEHGCAYDVNNMIAQAAHFGHIHILDWLLTQDGAQLTVDVMLAAAAGGQLLMCQHLRSIKCAWDASVCSAAAHNGHLNVLQYLHEYGCPLDFQACTSAAKGGNVQVIQYLVEHGLVQNAVNMISMLLYAGAHSQLAAVQWLRQRGAEWPQTLYYSNDSKIFQWSGEVLAWARVNGCRSPVP
jgi:hypothetical protein